MEITLEYIQQLASSHEGVDVEFKETTGQLNRGMETLCGMMNGNGGIANVMFISGLIEHWGRGLSLMDNECKRVELPVPQIYDDGFMVRVSFDRKNQAGSQGGQAEDQGGQAGGQGGQAGGQVVNQQAENQGGQTENQGGQAEGQGGQVKSQDKSQAKSQARSQARSQVRSQVRSQANAKQERKTIVNKLITRLIRIIGEDWLSANEILQELNLSSKGSLRKNYINPALEMRVIKLENPSKPNTPNQRYGLTMKGKSIYYREK
jgi:hypothetical protein